MATAAATAEKAEKIEKKSAPKGDALAMVKRDVVDVVADRVQKLCHDGELHLPENYSAANAMKAAWLTLQDVEDKEGHPALQVCTQNSIANALLDMVVQGLNPGKQQCYFIVYGKTLTCQRGYLGSIALLRRIYGQETEVWGEVVYEGDEFEYAIDRGRKRVVRHVQKLENISSQKILAAYVVIEIPGREAHTELMTSGQIQRAWEQGQTKGKSPAHTGFPDEMSKKTVINRAVKILIKGSDDAVLLKAIERSELSSAEAALSAEAAETANRELLEFPERKALPATAPTVDEAQAASAPEPAQRENGSAAASAQVGPGF